MSTAQSKSGLLAVSVERSKRDPLAPRPPHHVTPGAAVTAPKATWSSYFPTWTSGKKNEPSGFRNPWPSWYKPNRAEVWDSLEWGEDTDPCIGMAASHLDGVPAPSNPPEQGKRPTFGDVTSWPNSTGAKAARLLSMEQPDFSFPSSPSRPKAKLTWLGHASMLLQLPPLTRDGQPLRCLFDPIFSMRCAPSQTFGPIRSYPPPCRPEDLPPIDAVFISHNHYDHLDLDTILAIWKKNEPTVHFFVPLGNKQLFIDSGLPAERVSELDWWDSAQIAAPLNAPNTKTTSLKIWCTPAQHSSGRLGLEADSTLWSSWYLEHPDCSGQKPYRIFFAGDTGYQYHSSSAWPPSPPPRAAPPPDDDEKSPACPAFAEIRDRLGPPHLLLLPVAVGATYAYLRSFFLSLPTWISPFPRHSAGMPAATHMPPWDAVHVMKLMTAPGPAREGSRSSTDGRVNQGDKTADSEPAVAVAMHWGTFVSDPAEVLKTLGQLEWACQQQDVHFARSESSQKKKDVSVNGESANARKERSFLALNHGQSIVI
ncbi:beta-lactamase superfamily domain-containing protein [Podospora didyma]|uniref:Beta-lactamase superfamily domain-containing protein n=1 Tax=Podospora didyma TaxID=330526 RepID=A0AAE0U907_9PEZI|nr:beta-lactamase superfamily domain-containing protein [Podospora didyma]